MKMCQEILKDIWLCKLQKSLLPHEKLEVCGSPHLTTVKKFCSAVGSGAQTVMVATLYHAMVDHFPKLPATRVAAQSHYPLPG